MLKRQMHLRNKLDVLDLNKVIYRFEQTNPLGDRIGGFWTSTFDENFGCEYLHSGKIYKPYAHVFKGYVFRVNPTAKVFYVSSQEDEYILREQYDYDFNQLAMSFDCIHVTSDYIRHIKENRIESNFLFWTCECTWWFNIEALQLVKVLEGEEIKKLAETNFIN